MKKSSIQQDIREIPYVSIYVRTEFRYGKKAIVTAKNKIMKNIIYFLNVFITPETITGENKRLGIIKFITNPLSQPIGEIQIFKEEVTQNLYLIIYKDPTSTFGDKFAEDRRVELDKYNDLTINYKNNIIDKGWFDIIYENLLA